MLKKYGEVVLNLVLPSQTFDFQQKGLQITTKTNRETIIMMCILGL